MFINAEQDKEFFEEFNQKFKKFCQKAPVLLSFVTSRTNVILKNVYTDEENVFNLSLFHTTEENIRRIKMFLLENWYPVLHQDTVEERSLTTEESNSLIENGHDIDDVLTHKKSITKSVHWRIEKVILKKDQLVIRNLSTMKSSVYKMKMPVTLFLKRLREGKYHPSAGWEIFQEKSELLYQVENDRLLGEINVDE